MVLELLPVILKEKIVIRAKPDRGIAWHSCVVCSVCNNKVELGLSRYLTEEIVQTGSKIFCKYSTEFFEYLMEGTIDSIEPFPDESGKSGKIAGISINRVDERINDRITSRFDVYLAADAHSRWMKESREILINNISLAGLSFISPTRFETVEEYVFNLPLKDVTLALEGKIIRRFTRGDLFHYGVKFGNLSDSDREHLLKYFDFIIKNDEDLQAYYSSY